MKAQEKRLETKSMQTRTTERKLDATQENNLNHDWKWSDCVSLISILRDGMIIPLLSLHAPCTYGLSRVVLPSPRRAKIIPSRYTVAVLPAMLSIARVHQEMMRREQFVRMY